MPHAPQPSLVTIEVGPRRAGTLAVLLLSAGIAMGLGIAKGVTRGHGHAHRSPAAVVAEVAANARAAVSWPSLVARPAEPVATPSETITLAPMMLTRAHHRHHAIASADDAPTPPSTDLAATTAAPAPRANATTPHDGDDEWTLNAQAATVSSLVNRELTDAL